jgi:acyl-coenzyme A synthetase/AMP-(fatty) acid ligase
VTADRRLGAERLAAVFAGDGGHVFLREAGEAWTVDRLLAWAGDVARAVPADAGPLVAVRSHSTAFVIASLAGLWNSGRSALLIDPALGTEPSGLRPHGRRVHVIAPADVVDPWSDIGVPESGGAPLVPRFPAAAEPEVAFFTSGSTGEPKIIRKKAFQFGEQHRVEAPWLGLDGPMTVVSLVPAFHILGYIYGLSTPAAGRGTTVFSRGGSPQGWVDLVRGERPRLVIGVPSHYRLMVQVLDAALPEALYLCSGGPLDPAIAAEFERRAGWPVVQVYGSTETGGIAIRRGAGPLEPFPELAWKSRESDRRLMIRSGWQEPPADWHCTDDVVAVDGETFRLLGRADSVVKIGGRRFSTGEIVQTALAAPGVAQAHALAYDRFGEPAIALFVVASNGVSRPPGCQPLSAADVRSHLASRLASFKVPRTIHVLAELPTRGIGKVDEAALRALAINGV